MRKLGTFGVVAAWLATPLMLCGVFVPAFAHAAGPMTGQVIEQRQAEIVKAFYADKFADAEKLARALIADVEAETGPDSPSIWEPLNLLASVLDERGAYGEAEALWRRVLSMRLASTLSLPGDTALILSNLGQNLTIRGKFAEADVVFAKAADLVVRNTNDRDPLLAKIYNNWAMNQKAAGNPRSAQTNFEKALAISIATLGERDAQVAEMYDNLGLTLKDIGKLKDAEATIRKALSIWADTVGANSSAMARGRGNLGLVLTEAGNLPEAESETRQSIAIQTSVFGEAAAASYSNLSLILTSQNRFADAEPIGRKAVALFEKNYGTSHPSTATAYDNLTIILSSLGRSAEAEPLNRKALAIRVATFGPDSADAALSYNNLAGTLAGIGRFPEAQVLLEKAIGILRQTLGSAHPQLASTLRNTAEIYALAGRQADSERLNREALSIRLALFGKDSLEAAQSYISTADAVNEQGRSAEAETLAAQAVAAGRASRTRTATAVQDRATVDPAANVYESYTRIAWAAAAQKPADDDRLRAASFSAAQELVHSASGDAMAMASARIAAGTGPLAAIVAEQQDLSARVVDIDKRLLSALGKQDQTNISALRQQESALQSRLKALDVEIDRSFPDYRALISPAPLTVTAVQKLLAPDEGLLFLVTVGDDVYSFAATSRTSAWHLGHDDADLARAQIRHLRCQVDVEHCPGTPDSSEIAPDSGAHSAHFDLRMANQLYQELIAPVEPALAGAKRIYVTASSALGDLPLGMLVTAAPDVDADDADPAVLAAAPWLSDRYALTYLPSVAGLALKSVASGASTKRVAFAGYGDPTLTGDGTATLDRGAKYYRGLGRSGLPLADPGMIRSAPPLPGTRRELQAMALALGAPANAVHLQGAATETAVKADGGLANANVIAFATHGILPGNLNGFNEPGLILTPPTAATDIDDGVLTASEASQLRLSADWVILSACNTAATEGADGADSLSGLARGFLYSGARALLASHWAVSDDATAALTVETLTVRKLHPDITRAQAFQQAMRTVRTGKRRDGTTLKGYEPGWAHPAAWAPFTHIANFDD
jgi:CHAT domain-containing protein/tetratricopeptide (TPR) repeat protein